MGSELFIQKKPPYTATNVSAELQKESGPSSFGGGKAGFWEEFESLQRQECKHLYSRVKVGHGQVLLSVRV